MLLSTLIERKSSIILALQLRSRVSNRRNRDPLLITNGKVGTSECSPLLPPPVIIYRPNTISHKRIEHCQPIIPSSRTDRNAVMSIYSFYIFDRHSKHSPWHHSHFPSTDPIPSRMHILQALDHTPAAAKTLIDAQQCQGCSPLSQADVEALRRRKADLRHNLFSPSHGTPARRI